MDVCINYMKSWSVCRLWGESFGESFEDILKRISINSVDSNGQTLLHHAIKLKKKEYVDFLLKNRIDTKIKDHYGDNSLSLAIKEHYTYAVVSIIANNNPDLKKERDDFESKFKRESRKRTFAESQVKELREECKKKTEDIKHLSTNPFHVNNINLTYENKELKRSNSILNNSLKNLEESVENYKTKYFNADSLYRSILLERDELKSKKSKIENELAKTINDRDIYKKRWETIGRDKSRK